MRSNFPLKVLAITLLLFYCTSIAAYAPIRCRRSTPNIASHVAPCVASRFFARGSRLFATQTEKTTGKTAKIALKTVNVPNTTSSWEDAKDGMTLVIVESPAKARTIQKFVDEGSFIIDSCAGMISA